MIKVWWIAREEFSHGLDSRAGYLLMIFFAAATALPVFWTTSGSNVFLNGVADLRYFFSILPYAFLAFAPAAAMGLWSDERRSGGLEWLLGQGTQEWQVVVGKFLGAYAFLVLALAATAMVPLLIGRMGDLDIGPLIGGYLAALLLAAACLATGMISGYAFRNPVSAYVAGAATLALLMTMAPSSINFHSRFVSIARGLLHPGDLTFYFLVTAVFLAVNTWLLRWRR